MTDFYDEMLLALEMAKEAHAAGDHPYGSVIVTANGAIAERNRVVTTSDPTAHSEVTAIRAAASQWGLDSLTGATLVTSFEPCPMCVGAVLAAGLSNVVIAARRTVGEAPLGDYTVERLLALTTAPVDVKITEGVGRAEAEAFYANVS